MKRVALDLGARHRGVQEPEVERGVVPDQHRAAAVLHAHGAAHLGEDRAERVVLGRGDPQRVVRIDAVDGERGGVESPPSNGRT